MHLDSSLLGGLRCFEVAARLLSFTKAASELCLTQGAVSQQIRNLEERLGYPLFFRQSRALALTEKGETLYRCASETFRNLEQTLNRLAQPNVPLVVSCLPSFALQWLMPRLVEFHRIHPHIEVRLKAEFHALDLQKMQTEGIDLAIRFDPRQYEEMSARPILDEFLLPVATSQYLALHPHFSNGEDLLGVELLHDSSPWDGAPEFIEWRTWLETVRPEWLNNLGGSQFNLAVLAISAALNHQGVAMARTALVYDEIACGSLVNVYERPVPASGRYILLTQRTDDPRVAIFADWLIAECHRFDEARQKLLSPKEPVA